MNETNLMCSVSTKGDYIAIFAKLPSDFEKECANCIVFYDLLKLSLGEDYVEPLRTQYTDVLTFGGNIAVKKKKITCSSWSKQKNKYNNSDDDVIACGSSKGTIQFYGMCERIHLSDIYLTEEQNDKNKVNDICWVSSSQFKDKNDLSSSLYACSEDGMIFECSSKQAQPISKWKASESAIISLSLVDKVTSKYLLSACLKSITVWDLNTKTKINSFIHHSNNNYVTRMIHLGGVNNQFFVTVSNDDIILKAWKLDDLTLNDRQINDSYKIELKKEFILTDAVTTAFSLTDKPTFNTNLYEFALISAVTPNGNLFIHCTKLSSDGFESIKSVFEVEILNKNDKEKRLNVFSAFFLNKSTNERSNYFDQSQTVCDLKLALVYGSLLMEPIFENIDLSTLVTQPKTILYRNDPYNKISSEPPTWSLSKSAFIAKINEQASQLIFICSDSKNEQHRDRLYSYNCEFLYNLIQMIPKFETLLLVWQDVLASLNESMKKRSYKNCQVAFEIVYHIFKRKYK